MEGQVEREANGAARVGRGVRRYARRRGGVCGGRGLIPLLQAAADIHLLEGRYLDVAGAEVWRGSQLHGCRDTGRKTTGSQKLVY